MGTKTPGTHQRRLPRRWLAICLVALTFVAASAAPSLAQPCSAPAAPCNVAVSTPAGAFTNLQQAIDAASNGAAIVVTGTCSGPVNISARANLIITGVPPAANANCATPVGPADLVSSVTGSDDEVIKVTGSTGIAIAFLNIVGGESSGIELKNGSGNIAACNCIARNEDEGVELDGGTVGQIVLRNLVTENGKGVRVKASATNTLVQNGVVNNDDDGILLYRGSSANTLVGNAVQNNGDDGIEIENSNGNIVAANAVTGNDEDGIDLDFANTNQILTNAVTGNGTSSSDNGIELRESDNNTVNNNTINGNTDGLVNQIRCQSGSNLNTGNNVVAPCDT
jgi:parallel beta-helix repeat protein